MGSGQTSSWPFLLVVEDEPGMVSLLRRTLTRAGYLVEFATRGDLAADLACSTAYDLIILDVELPGRSGLDILRELRRRGRETPVLLLTGRSGDEAVASGLDLGADDYLEKPFSVVELKARCRALLRRAGRSAPAPLQMGNLRMDRAARQVLAADRPVDLPPRAYDMLHALLRSPERVVERDDLLRSVWGLDFDPGTNRVDVTISRLRRALEEAGSDVHIETVRGVGFRLTQ